MTIFNKLSWVLVGLLTAVLVYQYKDKLKPFFQDENTTAFDTIQQIEQLGKIELVKCTLTDALTYKKENVLLADDQILLLVKGEAVGCIDLTKITPKDLLHTPDTLFVTLPAPELCYCKLNHEQTKVFDLTYTKIFDKTALVAEAFAQAEQNITQTALQSGVLEQTKVNAVLVLTPILQTLTDKKVVLSFVPPTEKIILK
jgi:hypothetical protein